MSNSKRELGKGTRAKIDRESKVKKLEALAAGLTGLSPSAQGLASQVGIGAGLGSAFGFGFGFPGVGIGETEGIQQQQQQQQQSQADNINLLLLLKSVMTELDSSSPVIWPSWCYGTENGQDDEKSSTTNNSSGLNLNEKPNKRRRRDVASDRDRDRDRDRERERVERSSPRSPSDSTHGGASDSEIKRSPPPPPHRNYSDFMRSLAAKYNNHLPAEPPAPQPATLFSRQQMENNRFLQKSLIDMSSTTTLLQLVRSADLKKYHQTPLDLTNNNNNNNNNNGSIKKSESNCCSSQEVMNILSWSVDEVVRFVSSIDLCKEYAEKFRTLDIDGSGLPLLTEEHLVSSMGMKLGQALKFKSVLQRRLGNCVICNHHCPCHASNNSNINNNNNSNSSNLIN